MTVIPFIEEVTVKINDTTPITLSTRWLETDGTVCIDQICLSSNHTNLSYGNVSINTGTRSYKLYSSNFQRHYTLCAINTRIFIPGRCQIQAYIEPANNVTEITMTVYGYTQSL